MSSLFKNYISGIARHNPNSIYRPMSEETSEHFITYDYSLVDTKKSEIHFSSHFQDYLEIIYVISSSLDVTVNNHLFTLTVGDLIIILPGDVHKIHSSSNAKYVILEVEPEFLFTTLVSSVDLQYVVPSELSTKVDARHFHCNILDNTEIPKLIYNVIIEYSEKKAYYQLAIRTSLSRIILYILRYWEEVNLLIRTDITPMEKPSFPKLAVVIERINTDYDKELTATEMAKLADMSYSYFSRTFKQMVGENFSEHLNNIRIKESQKLLCETDMPISDIATKVGFGNTSYYISQFKKSTDMTPKKYRDTYHNLNKNKK